NVPAGTSIAYNNPVSGTGNSKFIKNGDGLLTLLAANTGFTATMTVNSGTVLLDDLGASGDLNATNIIINNGGKFIFGENNNADFPNSTLVTINTGGVFELKQGENFGAVILLGGEYRTASTFRTADR